MSRRRRVLRRVEVHAQVVAVAVLRKVVAAHALRPREAVLTHERRASGLGALAHGAARRKRLVVVAHADRRVHAAQEELQVERALDLDERPELVHLQAGLLLRVVVELVRHVRQVVPDATAHRDRDFLALSVIVASTGSGRDHREQEQRREGASVLHACRVHTRRTRLPDPRTNL